MFPLDKKTKYVKIKKSVNFFVYYFVVFNGLFFFYELFLLNLKYMNMKKKMILFRHGVFRPVFNRCLRSRNKHCRPGKTNAAGLCRNRKRFSVGT